MNSKKLLGVFASFLLVSTVASCSGGFLPSNPSVDPTTGSDPTSADPTTVDPTTSVEDPTTTEDPTTAVDPTTGGEPAEDFHITEPVSIEFWNTKGSPYQGVIENAIESFKLVEPNVTVTNVKQSVGISELQSVVTKGFTSGVYPDIVEGYPDAVSTYMDYDMVVQLDDLMEDSVIGWTEEERADYVEAYIKEGQQYIFEGTYSLPFSKSTEIMLYNKTLLNGIDLSNYDPTINNGRALNDRYFSSLTWDEFFGKLCPALMAWNADQPVDERILDTDLPDYAILGYDSDDNLAITLTQQYGLPFTSLDRDSYVGSADFNTTEMADKFEWLSEQAQKKYLTTQGGLGTYTNSLLADRGVLFLVSSTGGLSHCTVSGIEIGAAMPFQPAEGEGTDKVISQGPSICLLKHNTPDAKLRQEAAWLFYKHLTNYNNGLAWALNGGYSPVRHSVRNSETYQNAVDPDNITSVDSLDHLQAVVNQVIATDRFSNALYTTPAFKGSAECRSELGSVLENVIAAAADGSPLTRAQIEELLNNAWSLATTAINK